MSQSLRELDAGSRALLDLTLRLEVSDAEIAELLGSTPELVERQRSELLDRLGSAHAVDSGEIATTVSRELHELASDRSARPEETPPQAAEAPARVDDANGADPAVRAPAPAPAPGRAARRRRGRTMLVVLLAAAAIVAVAVAVSAGAGEEPATGGSSAPDSPAEAEPADEDEDAPAADPTEAGSELEPLPAAPRGVSGGVALEQGRLELQLEGLPGRPGDYEVWLYDSVIDSVSLGRLQGNGALSARLPRDPSSFRFLDVSLERGDGGPAHSGRSVLRLPIASLLDR